MKSEKTLLKKSNENTNYQIRYVAGGGRKDDGGDIAMWTMWLFLSFSFSMFYDEIAQALHIQFYK